MSELTKRFGGWMRNHASRVAVGRKRDLPVLFEDLWPLCFVPEAAPGAQASVELPGADLLSADLPLPAESAAH